MCGIAGIIYRNGNGGHAVGHDMTAMLQSMKHRGPDSTGYALFAPASPQIVMRYTLADATAVATYLNIFVRRCRTVRMANLAQLVNVIAPIRTSPGCSRMEPSCIPSSRPSTRTTRSSAGSAPPGSCSRRSRC